MNGGRALNWTYSVRAANSCRHAADAMTARGYSWSLEKAGRYFNAAAGYYTQAAQQTPECYTETRRSLLADARKMQAKALECTTPPPMMVEN